MDTFVTSTSSTNNNTDAIGATSSRGDNGAPIDQQSSAASARQQLRQQQLPRRRLSTDERILLVRLWTRYRGDIRVISHIWKRLLARARNNNTLVTATIDAPTGPTSQPTTIISPRSVVVTTPINGRLIRATVQRFLQNGSVLDRKRPGRDRSVRVDSTIERVRASIATDPTLSTRKRSRLLGISRSSLMRIQRSDLRVKAYKLQLVQQLLPMDTNQRKIFCETLLSRQAECPELVHNLIMGDEAHFELSGAVFNKQNVRFWSTENPKLWRPKPLHPERVTVWCGVSSVGILGPYFYENANNLTQSVTGARYRAMLRDYVFPLLRNDARFKEKRDWWWQQDGATAHTARATMSMLTREFGANRIISRGAAIKWPARSPDLAAPDYFLWGYLKDRVYGVIENANAESASLSRTTRADLKRAIVREVELLNSPERECLLRSVMANLLVRARMCLRTEGRHLVDVIFHT